MIRLIGMRFGPTFAFKLTTPVRLPPGLFLPLRSPIANPPAR